MGLGKSLKDTESASTSGWHVPTTKIIIIVLINGFVMKLLHWPPSEELRDYSPGNCETRSFHQWWWRWKRDQQMAGFWGGTVVYQISVIKGSVSEHLQFRRSNINGSFSTPFNLLRSQTQVTFHNPKLKKKCLSLIIRKWSKSSVIFSKFRSVKLLLEKNICDFQVCWRNISNEETPELDWPE